VSVFYGQLKYDIIFSAEHKGPWIIKNMNTLKTRYLKRIEENKGPYMVTEIVGWKFVTKERDEIPLALSL